jgi:hypothetical protein
MSEQRLRTALRELGDVPAPADLAGGALARASRDRRRARAGLAAAVVLAVIAAIAVPTALLRRPESAPAAPARAVWVAFYATALSGDVSSGRSYYYDPVSRGYRALPDLDTGAIVAASPDGSRVVVAQGTGGKTGRTAIVDIDRLPAGLTEADWSAGAIPDGFWSWSPDGTRLLSTEGGRPPEPRVLDVRTRAVTRVPIALYRPQYGDGLSWGPRGRGFVVSRWVQVRDRGAASGQPLFAAELAVLDDAGRLIRRYPLPLPSQVDDVRLSPGGGRALLLSFRPADGGQPDRRAWVLDLGTGSTTPLGTVPTGWYDERTLFRVDVPAAGPSEIVLLDASTERVVRRSVPPIAGPRQLSYVGLARGTPPPGAIVP